jgi:hypothetical protein
VKKAKRQLNEGQLDRCVMLDDEDPQEMYNRLRKLVNKVRAYGLKRWGDRRVIDRMLRAYAVKDTKDKHYKKKTYGEEHIGKEWDSDSDSDGVSTVANKDFSSSSSKSLFPNLNKEKHTCLMAKESKKKVKSKSSPPKYVSSDDEQDSSDEEDEETLLIVMSKNPNEEM